MRDVGDGFHDTAFETYTAGVSSHVQWDLLLGCRGARWTLDIVRPKTGPELSHEGGQPPQAELVRHAQHSQREGLMSHSSCSEPKQRKRNHRPAHDEIFSWLSAKSSQRRECFTLLSDVSILISLTSTPCLPHSSTLAHHVLQCPASRQSPCYPQISLASRHEFRLLTLKISLASPFAAHLLFRTELSCSGSTDVDATGSSRQDEFCRQNTTKQEVLAKHHWRVAEKEPLVDGLLVALLFRIGFAAVVCRPCRERLHVHVHRFLSLHPVIARGVGRRSRSDRICQAQER